MWPLLACSIVSVTTMILRGLALKRKQVMPPAIEEEIERLAPGESPERLSRLVHYDRSSLARVVRVALQHLRAPRAENVEAVQTRARDEMVSLERGLLVLVVDVDIATTSDAPLPPSVPLNPRPHSAHELRSAKTACSSHHHRFARRYSHHSADLFCRLDDFQKGPARGAN